MRFLPMVLVGVLVSGCTAFWQGVSGESAREGRSSNLVEFLYPDGEEPPPVDEVIPVLDVPLRVGLAFVPSRSGTPLPATDQHRLLERVRSRFVDQDYIRDIVIIPEAYLANVRGFDALEQVGRLHNLDVMALVSYDQLSIAEDRASSFLYWTIVGAYVVKGSQNDVRTFVDTAVFDLKTRKLLFRAPGINELTSNATLVRSAEKMRDAREKSFDQAVGDMSTNLVAELDRFETRIKEDRSVLIAQRDGSKGSGSFDAWLLLLLAGGLLLRPRFV